MSRLQAIEAGKQVLKQFAAEAEGKWVTIRGRRVFIGKGESMRDALQRSLGKGGGPSPMLNQGSWGGKEVTALESRLKAAGWKRSKDPDRGNNEYKFIWLSPNGRDRVMVNYRFGQSGTEKAWLGVGIQKPEGLRSQKGFAPGAQGRADAAGMGALRQALLRKARKEQS